MVGIHSEYEMKEAKGVARALSIEERNAVTLGERIEVLKQELAALESRAAELKQVDVRTPAEKAADDAMCRVWSAWVSYFSSRRLTGADRMAFYEIAQPILRKLADDREWVASYEKQRKALVFARQKLVCYRAVSDGKYVGGMEYTGLLQLIDEALAL